MSDTKLSRIQIFLAPAEVKRLTAEAQRLNISRNELIRNNLSTQKPQSQHQPQPKYTITFDRFTHQRAVEAVAKVVPGIPRAQLEWTVSTVINSIAS